MRQLINHMQKFKLTENAIPLRSIIAPLLSLSSCWFIPGGDEIPKSTGVVATMRWVPLVLLTATLELERVNADVTGTEIPNNNSKILSVTRGAQSKSDIGTENVKSARGLHLSCKIGQRLDENMTPSEHSETLPAVTLRNTTYVSQLGTIAEAQCICSNAACPFKNNIKSEHTWCTGNTQ